MLALAPNSRFLIKCRFSEGLRSHLGFASPGCDFLKLLPQPEGVSLFLRMLLVLMVITSLSELMVTVGFIKQLSFLLALPTPRRKIMDKQLHLLLTSRTYFILS